MKRKIYLFLLTGLFSIEANLAKSQTIDSLSLHQVDFLERKLSASKNVATKVDSILFNYKKMVYQLFDNQKIGRQDKDVEFDKLVLAKYYSLKTVLNDDQIAILLPTTELKVLSDLKIKR